MIQLLKDPSGERVSKIKIAGLAISIFLIIVLPITYYMSLAKAEREKQKEEKSRMLINGDVPASLNSNSIIEQLKQNSNDAVSIITTDNSALSAHKKNDAEEVPTVSSDHQQERPPIVASGNVPSVNSNPIAVEISNQKLDRVKKLYSGVNAPISLGSQYQNPNTEPTGINPSNPTNNPIAQPSDMNVPSAPVNQGIGLGGSLNNPNNAGNGGFSGMAPNSNSSSSSSQDQNMQDEKKAFLANAAGGDALTTTNPNRVTSLKSKYTLTAGDFIPSIMISGLNSDTPGQVIAQVNTNIYDTVSGKYLLIPKASRLIGIYDSKVAYMQQRIIVAWKRVIFPDGKSFLLQGLPGTDVAGYSGFYNPEGIDNHYWQIFGSSFIMGVITGAMQLSQNNTNANAQAGGNGFTNNDPTVGQTLSGSLGQQLGQTGLAITNKGLQVQPTITIPPGYQFNIMLTADLILTPYGKQYK